MAASELKPELRLVRTPSVRFHEHAERRRTVRLIRSICAGLSRVPDGPDRPREWTLPHRQTERSPTHCVTPSFGAPPVPDRLCAAPWLRRQSGSGLRLDVFRAI